MPGMPLLVLFCADPLHSRSPDETNIPEIEAIQRVGAQYALISYEALVDEHDAARAVRFVPERPAPALGIYRGWMLRPARYAELYEASAARNITLVNNPAAYIHCHYLPESYPIIARQTPRTVWLRTGPNVDDTDIDHIMALLQPFGDAPLIIKDFVKSRKHEWAEACYIPFAADRAAVERVVRRFIELQGDNLCEGLVFREYIELAPLAEHSKSGMPLAVEYRIFVLDGQPIAVVPYWEQGDYDGELPPLGPFRDVMRAVRNRLYTMDLACRREGDWLIVELGDGQVAGLPDRTDVDAFYAALLDSIP